jgi:hypothetical protein
MNQTNKKKTYSELCTMHSFEDRFKYLKLDGTVGTDTFGFDRYINQKFYRSKEWKAVRDYVIVRDNACDLGVSDRPIFGKVYIHHMNPITLEDISSSSDNLLDPEYLITTVKPTHDAIHYGDESLLVEDFIERSKNDTCPWKS